MTHYKNLRLGLTKVFPCSYLPNEFEQLLVVIEENGINEKNYEKLLGLGFRRSGDQVYRPHCPECTNCKSLRVIVEQFKPTKSQKRIYNKNKRFTVNYTHTEKDEYYDLYENYVNTRHKDGSMYPATHEQYQGFILCNWHKPLFIELYDEGVLIGVAVSDEFSDSLSAIYTFFHPDYDKYSLGTFLILQQIEFAKIHDKQFVYLGYQIDACNNMNYKNHFSPNEQIIDNVWTLSL